MNKVQLALSKYIVIPIYVIAVLAVFSFFRGCSNSKENSRMRNEVTTLSAEVDSLTKVINTNFYTKEEQETIFEIQGYEISKRMLYDQNAIVRTVIRPDDRMNEYDQEIAKLRKKLSK